VRLGIGKGKRKQGGNILDSTGAAVLRKKKTPSSTLSPRANKLKCSSKQDIGGRSRRHGELKTAKGTKRKKKKFREKEEGLENVGARKGDVKCGIGQQKNQQWCDWGTAEKTERR